MVCGQPSKDTVWLEINKIMSQMTHTKKHAQLRAWVYVYHSQIFWHIRLQPCVASYLN